MMESGSSARLTGMENLDIKRAPFTKGSGSLISNMVLDLKCGLTEAAMRATMCRASKMDLVSTDGQMAPSTLVIGLTMKYTGLVITSGWMADSILETGFKM